MTKRPMLLLAQQSIILCSVFRDIITILCMKMKANNVSPGKIQTVIKGRHSLKKNFYMISIS